MGILDSLPQLIDSVMGDLLFSDAILKRKGTTTISDGRGGVYHGAFPDEACKVVIEEYSDFIRAQGGIAPNERKAIILAHGLATPKPEDKITIDGRDWVIVDVQTDPAKATYTCRVK